MDSQVEFDSWMFDDDFVVIKPRCNICLDYGHHADKCPMDNSAGNRLFGENLNSYPSCPSQDQWCSQWNNFGHSSSYSPEPSPSLETRLSKQEETVLKLTEWKGLVIKALKIRRENNDQVFGQFAQHIEALEQAQWNSDRVIAEQAQEVQRLQASLKNMENNDQILARYEKRITTLEQVKINDEMVLKEQTEKIEKLEEASKQAKSRSEEIIKAQAEKIKVLEATVEGLELQLDHCDERNKERFEDHAWRLEGANISVKDLKEKWAQIDRTLCFKFGGDWPNNNVVNHCVKACHEGISDSSDNEDDCSIMAETLSFWEQECSIRDEKEPYTCEDSNANIVKLLGGVTVIESTNGWLSEDLKTTPSPMEHEKKNEGKRQKGGWIPTQNHSHDKADMWEEKDIFGALFNDSLTVDIPQENHEPLAETSCKCCGLSCVTQLRACVNMINVKPSMSKVKESEVKAMKSKKKSKLEQVWVPRGMFDIKELFKANTINFEDQCVKPLMPRWKKRKKKTPTTCDSCD